MKRLISVLSVVAVAIVSTASAGEYRGPLFPAPAAIGYQGEEDKAPAPEGVEAKEAAPAKAEAIELYKCVKVRDPHHVAPCAEKKLIKVLDPCWKPAPCGCCAPKKPKCVYIEICVPKKVECHHHVAPCGKPAPPKCCAPAPPKCCDKCHACACKHRELRHTCSKDGRYQKFDYGKYRVEVRVKKGYIEVDYDD